MDTDIDVSGMMSSDDGGAGKPSRKRVAFTPVSRFPIISLYLQSFYCVYLLEMLYFVTARTIVVMIN